MNQTTESCLMNAYTRYGIILRSGIGCTVTDAEGRTFLDLIGGIACCPLGHAHPKFVKAVLQHAASLTNTSNLFHSENAERLAERLCQIGGMKKAFFSNSGTEANEAALKLAMTATKKRRFIACKNAFHGRTLGSLSATYDKKYRQGFQPPALEVDFVEFGSPKALEKAIRPETAAFIVEPIQGEAGVIVPDKDYLKQVREICDEKEILLILDEVQSGNGRTGSYFEYLAHHITPDIVTTSKGLANGLPIGATLSRELDFKPGQHASTFGGNDFVTAVARVVVDAIEKDGLKANAKKQGEKIMQGIKKLGKKEVTAVRGAGLMIGIELRDDAQAARQKLQDLGVLVSVAHGKTIRLLPPLILQQSQADSFIQALDEALDTAGRKSNATK